MRCLAIVGLVCGLTLMSAMGVRADIIIDNFNVSLTPIVIDITGALGNGTTKMQTEDGITGVQGGAREVSVTLDSGGGTRKGTLTTINDNGDGAHSFSNQQGVKATLFVRYDADKTLGRQDGLNLNLSSATGFVFDINESQPGITDTTTLCHGGISSCSMASFATTSLAGGIVFLPFSAFSPILTLTDLQDVDVLEFKLTSTAPAVNMSINEIRALQPVAAAPEPAAILLMVTGLVGLGVMRVLRRRQRP